VETLAAVVEILAAGTDGAAPSSVAAVPGSSCKPPAAVKNAAATSSAQADLPVGKKKRSKRDYAHTGWERKKNMESNDKTVDSSNHNEDVVDIRKRAKVVDYAALISFLNKLAFLRCLNKLGKW